MAKRGEGKEVAQAGTEEAAVSKSQRKREMQDLQALGEQLAGLPDAALGAVDVDEAVRSAVGEWRRISSHGARRRQLRYIAKQLSLLDPDRLSRLRRSLEGRGGEERARQHRLERWRDRLLGHGDAALGEFLAQYPTADRQQLRTLLRSAERERLEGRPPAAARKLFRYLRDAVEGSTGGHRKSLG